MCFINNNKKNIALYLWNIINKQQMGEWGGLDGLNPIARWFRVYYLYVLLSY
jgi:hypothetical protein